MGKFIDLTEQKFGRLFIMHPTKKRCGSSTIWKALCGCGNYTYASVSNLMNGNTKSCGCLQRERTAESHIKHGHAVGGRISREYSTWVSMVKRCSDPKEKAYEYYGGRGINVCDRWKNSFLNFLIDMGKRPEGMTIDRINNEGNYELSNCKWSTMKEQCNNRRERKYAKKPK